MTPAGPIFPAGGCGLAETPPEQLGRSVLAAWDAFLEVVTAPGTDLARPSRLPGWSGLDVCTHLGAWPDSQVVPSLLASAREGGGGTSTDQDATNARLLAAHRDASLADVVQSLVDARAALERFFASDDARTLGTALSRSTAGPLPVLGLVNAGSFELAVHALDLAPCGAPPPPPVLLDRGLSALLDVTGALASRAGVTLTLGALTPTGGWGFAADGARGWRTQALPPGRLTGVGVEGSAPDLLDAAAGRTHLAQLLLTRRLVVHQLPQWMRLAPLLDDVPGLPGGATLQAAVGSVTGLAGGVGRVLGRLRR